MQKVNAGPVFGWAFPNEPNKVLGGAQEDENFYETGPPLASVEKYKFMTNWQMVLFERRVCARPD